MPETQAGEPEVGLRTLTPVGEPLRQNFLPVCGKWWVWDLIIYRKHLSYHLIMASSLSLGVEYLFW